MISKSTLSFLSNLKKNNNKEWFDKHKAEFLAAKENMEKTVENLIQAIAVFDKSISGLDPRKCVFRIYKDVRFSKDKSPYKTNLGASINPNGKKAVEPVYYLHIEPGNSFIAGGVWMPPSAELKKIRQEIDYNGKALKKILSSPAFKKQFGGLSPEYKLKTTPKGYDKNHPDIELLRHNSYIVWSQLPDKVITSASLVKELAGISGKMKPFIDFLRTALS
jgi:uncharacterized protein (TIGR02453 family)